MNRYSEDHVPSRLALASVLVQYGSPNFDSIAGTTIVSDLMLGLSKDSIVTHVKFLCGIMRNAFQDPDDEEGSSAISALEAVVLLARNNKLEMRNYVAILVIGILMRLSCFEMTRTKQKKVKASSPTLPEDTWPVLVECLSELDQHGQPPDIVRETAATKLLSLLSDIGFINYEKESSPSFLDFSILILEQLLVSYHVVRGDEPQISPENVLKDSLRCIKEISKMDLASNRAISAAKNAISFVTLQVLCSNDLDLQVSVLTKYFFKIIVLDCG